MTYAQAALAYFDKGWSPLPVVGKKGNLPGDRTGQAGVNPSRAEVEAWVADRPDDNLCLRMPANVVGIDVDDYGDKRGAETFAKAVAEWGPLPKTWRSSSRDGLSGIYFYRVPDGLYFDGRIELDGTADIEIIAWHYRFAVAWPSIHPKTGAQYRWSSPDGGDGMPTPDELPLLPETWLRALEKQAPAERLDPVEYEPQRADPEFWHERVAELFRELLEVADAPAGSRHDRMVEVTAELCRLERRGKTGATTALEMGENTWLTFMADERGRGDALREYQSAVAGGREMVATTATTAIEDEHLDWLLSAPEPEAEAPASADEPEPAASVEDEADEADPGFGRFAMTLAELEQAKPPEALVDSWLFKESLAAVSAPPKSGKTFITLDIAMAVASGTRWCGGNVRRQGRVMYLIGEGVSGMQKRVRAWQLAHPHADPSRHIEFFANALHLQNAESAMDFVAYAAQTKPDLIVIDTLARATVGMDENAAQDMGRIVRTLDMAKEASGACVLVVHHTGKDSARGLRGSSALPGALDTSIVLDGDVKNLWVRTEFQKDIEPALDFQVSFAKHGESIVPERAGMHFDRSADEEDVLAMLRWTPEAVPRGELKRLMSEKMDELRAFRAIGQLLLTGAVVNLGTDSAPRYVAAESLTPSEPPPARP